MFISKTQSQNNKNLKFLLIEDNKNSQQIMSIILTSFFDCQVHLADTKEEGIIETTNYVFDLILTNLDLSNINGTSITNILRNKANGKNKNTPIIVISGNIGKEESCFKVSIDAFLAKPFTIKELEELIETFGFLLRSK